MLSVDPGLRGCGCAWWTREGAAWSLVRAQYVPALAHEPEDKDDDGPVAWNAMVGAVELASAEFDVGVIAVERMKVYVRGVGDPRDLLALAAIGGGLVRAFPSARPIGLFPATWKGQVPREIAGARIEKRVRERGWWDRIVVPKRKTHLNDVMHAAGIGFYCIERNPAGWLGR